MDLTIYSILTVSIVGGAAILAFLIQRARYLREIEPDLRLELPHPYDIRISEIGHTLKDRWSFYIYVKVNNRSIINHAYDVKYKAKLMIFPQRGQSTFIPVDSIERWSLTPSKSILLAEGHTEIPIYIDPNRAINNRIGREEILNWPGNLEVINIGIHATVTIEYSTSRQFILFVLEPWGFGKKKYSRIESARWKLVKGGGYGPESYKAAFWDDHPNGG